MIDLSKNWIVGKLARYVQVATHFLVNADLCLVCTIIILFKNKWPIIRVYKSFSFSSKNWRSYSLECDPKALFGNGDVKFDWKTKPQNQTRLIYEWPSSGVGSPVSPQTLLTDDYYRFEGAFVEEYRR